MTVSDQIQSAKEVLQGAKNVFVLTGAGVSAESGVPTFRGGGGTSVWRGMPFEQLSSAQMVEKDLPLVWEWFDYRRGLVGECEPNAAHKALAHVQDSGRFEEFSIVTQNIDGLHQAAGAKSVIELHGSLWQARCLSCKTKKSLREIPEDERPPVCPECFDSMRPDVILFGEAMPMQSVYEAQEKAEKCDVCIVVGTSALVYPAAELPLIAKQSGAKIIEINPEETALTEVSHISLRGNAAEILPLIFAKDGSLDNRLPDENSVKLAAERTRKEKEAENSETTPTEENASPNDQLPESGFMTSESHALRVAFLQSDEIPFLNKLGLTFAPGKKQRGALSGNWNRDLTSDLTRLRGYYQADTLVSLVEDTELKALGIENLEDECRNHSIELIRFPLPDVSVPPLLKSFAGLIREIVKRLRQDKTVVVHCKGGLGRAGLVAACSIVAASDNKVGGEQAIKMVRYARVGAVETKEQENFISFFGEYWQLFKERTEDILRQQKTAAKEKVLEIGCEGGGADLYRFKTREGKWYFLTEGSSISLDENDDEEWIQWETEAVESIFEAIDSFKLGYQIFRFQPILIHPEIRADLKRYLENLYESLSAEEKGRLVYHNDSLITPYNWIYREMAWRAESDNFVDNEREKTNEVHEDIIQDPEELSDKHFLLYWQEKSVTAHRESGYPLDVVSSRQLKRAKAGDCLWIVTINSAGELILAGRLKIGEIVDYQTAVRKLSDTSLWDGGYFALPVEGKAEYLQPINIKDIQLDLRFANSEADRFVLKNGKINAQQLQTMCELSQESANLLAQIWESMQDEGRDDNFKDGFDLFDEENDAAELLEHCHLIVSQQPDSAEAHYNLGVALDENGLPEEAKTAYLKALELEPDYWTAYYNLGQYYLRARELDKAEQSFKDAARLAPEFAPARFMLGVVYGEMRDFERAIAVTKEGLESDPDDPKGHFNVGNFYFHLRDYEKAVQWLEQSLELAPDDPKTFYRLGECYRHLGSKQKELDAYLQAVELVPDFFDALSAAGTAYAHLTGTPEGKQVSYFEPGNEFSLLDARVFFYMGLGILALGNIEEARGTQEHLREMDASLAERLQFFIDRFVPEDESENDSKEFGLQWLKRAESGFDIRVLDCRPFTETRVSFAAEEQNALTFLSTRDSDGENHRGNSPENARSLSCDLSYPINALIYSPISNRSFETRDLPEGKLFSAGEMEEKWDVYYFDKYFYFVRSWTDKIAYRARVVEEGHYLNITEIDYDGEIIHEEDYHLRAVDYLLKTFVIGLTVPHPVPADVENTPESIAHFSFSFAGRHAKFASFEDTISAIPTLQAMDYVGPFDMQRIRQNEEQKEATPQIATSKKRELIVIFIDGHSFEAKNIPELYKAVLQFLADAGKLENVSIPVATGDKRYILAKEPFHPTGKPFFSPVEYKGFFMEAHNNREAAIAQLEKLIESVGGTFMDLSLNKLANILKEHQHKIDFSSIATPICVHLNLGNISGVERFLEEMKENLTDEARETTVGWLADAKRNAELEGKPKIQGSSSLKPTSKLNVFQGCLLGGAIGDTLGAAIEFDSIQTIRQKFGEQGLTDYAPAYGRIGAITDDTQMTLFTAEGLLRAITRGNHKGICHPPTIIYHAYLRWLETQGEKINDEQIKRWVYDEKSWLRDLPELNSRRAPGNSCLSALRSGRMGTIEEPINNSKGCGGVMRVAPIGLLAEDAFNLAMDAAAITHGHPTGYLSAGVLALIIRQIVDGKGLSEAVNHAVYEELPKHKNHEETFAACDKAIKMAQDKTVPRAPETIESLGGGWIAEEALAIAIYCSIVFENDFKKGVLLAVNHSGDSDSTGAITGNILGALHGAGEVQYYDLERLELKETIAEIAEDLLIGFKTGDDWWNKYPGI